MLTEDVEGSKVSLRNVFFQLREGGLFIQLRFPVVLCVKRALLEVAIEVKKQRAGHLLAYTTKRLFCGNIFRFGRKTNFNSRSRQRDGKMFFAKSRGDASAMVVQ